MGKQLAASLICLQSLSPPSWTDNNDMLHENRSPDFDDSWPCIIQSSLRNMWKKDVIPVMGTAQNGNQWPRKKKMGELYFILLKKKVGFS